ncbi:bifunctional 5,10-methylenetetrahydrofolate dehydrogenase/5,10-methenyltetrahydrofolate cyclohydrolase [Poriferisphaera sp. WC338]|uniref:bifunctional 5,10-methylenetetrahydrofolate dehydrogenase/5,10-methenyltetrahydrofolate cyclohydrolase n=1 Tax=Poriferisphaera sp. WC338 TaxID=3425129 RepID=UPI003D816854
MNTPTIIDGKKVSAEVQQQAADRVKKIIEKTGVTPCLVTVLVGSDPASVTYTRMKRKRCEAVGMKSMKVELPEETTTEQLLAKIKELGDDPAIHGILLQHPVPSQIDERAAFEAIPAAKDVDGVTIASFGAMAFDLPGFGCATPAGIIDLIDAYDIDCNGKHAVVIGRSPILGKPMAMMLLSRHATVTICHSRTTDLPGLVKQADIIVAAVGRPNFVQGDWVKPGAIVIDAGYNPGNIGDCDYEACAKNASMITPVPGGVGPTTIAALINQTSIGAARQLGLDLE